MNLVPHNSFQSDIQHRLADSIGQKATPPLLSARVLKKSPTDIQLACLFNIDNSQSMYDAGSRAIDELGDAIPRYLEQLRADAAIRSSILMTWGTFGSTKALELSGPFASVVESAPPSFGPAGGTPLGERIVNSVELLVSARKMIQSLLHVDQRHSWLIEMTDGIPTDDMQSKARKALRETAMEHGIEAHLFALGNNASLDYLRSIEQPGRPAKRLTSETNFADLFAWLKKSFASVSRSMAGEILEIPAIDGSLIRTE